ncbi:MAG TPA: phage holin family protein [Acidimicrobiales bacterium]|nr:phage holin family protein [Acidimicrobiales bacterium]
MSSATPNPQQGIANAVNDLGEQTAVLVRQEIDALKDEMLSKAKPWMAAVGLFGVAAGSGVLAAASGYRLLTRILDKLFGPVLGSLIATGGFGAVAAVAAQKGVRTAKDAPVPVPTATAEATRTAAHETLQRQTG